MTERNLFIADCTLPLGDPEVQRWDVSVTDGLVSSVEPHDPARRASGAEHIAADGRSLLPGFIDSHVHIPESGVEMLRCDMSACATRQAVLDTVQSYAANNPDEEWIVGRGWDGALFLREPATLAEIDRITGTRPAYLNNRDGHSVWVNSEALRRAGITRTTPDPIGGVIERDPHGELTGVLYESAMQLVSDLVPAVDRTALRAGLVAAQDYLLSLGVTGWQDAIVGDFVPTTDVYDLYRDTAADGTLLGRVTGSLWWPRDYDENSLAALVAQRDAIEPGSRFRCTSVKVMYDGWFSTHSAALSTPYAIGRADNVGVSFFDTPDMPERIRQIDAAGFDLHFHVVGDRAVAECVDMLEAAMAANGTRDRRHQLAHVWLLDDATIDRMARLGLIANLQAFWARHNSEMTDIIEPALPDGLRGLQLRFESLRRAGVPLAMGSDWPVSSANPMDAIHVAVNRHHPADSVGDGFILDEALPLRSALHAATTGSARAIRRDDEVGSVEVGKAADLVLLDRDVVQADPAELHTVRVDHTVIDGGVVFTR
jgi:predicted amidohydrolase YtcJ